MFGAICRKWVGRGPWDNWGSISPGEIPYPLKRLEWNTCCRAHGDLFQLLCLMPVYLLAPGLQGSCWHSGERPGSLPLSHHPRGPGGKPAPTAAEQRALLPGGLHHLRAKLQRRPPGPVGLNDSRCWSVESFLPTRTAWSFWNSPPSPDGYSQTPTLIPRRPLSSWIKMTFAVAGPPPWWCKRKTSMEM